MKSANRTPGPSFAPKFLFSVCIFVLGASLALAERESTRQLVAMPALAEPREDAESSRSKNFSCLPKDIRADEVVSYGPKGRLNVTVEKTLVEMKARCRNGKLVDAKGREVRFFRLSCWGNPPPDYLEIQQRENNELDKLKRRYRVIVFGCNPMIQ
jgi:hypothetical protein